MPRAGQCAREAGGAVVAVLGPQHWLWFAAAQGSKSYGADRDVCQVPRSAVPGARGLSAGAAVHGLLRASRAVGRFIPGRWADSGRGLRIRLVFAEQNVREPRTLQ